MAEVVEGYKFARKGRPVKVYPTEWFDGSVYVLTQGQDFTQATASFRTALAKAANGYGLKMRSSVEDDRVYVQAYTPTTSDTPRKARKTKAVEGSGEGEGNSEGEG